MNIKTSNGLEILITNTDLFESNFNNRLVPYIVILTAWNGDSGIKKFLESKIKFFLVNGTRFFVCVGDHSENLHDEIDNLIYQFDDEYGSDISSNIVTTFHNETIEDAVEYSVYSIAQDFPDNGCIVAVFDETDPRDLDLQKLLEKA